MNVLRRLSPPIVLAAFSMMLLWGVGGEFACLDHHEWSETTAPIAAAFHACACHGPVVEPILEVAEVFQPSSPRLTDSADFSRSAHTERIPRPPETPFHA